MGVSLVVGVGGHHGIYFVLGSMGIVVYTHSTYMLRFRSGPWRALQTSE